MRKGVLTFTISIGRVKLIAYVNALAKEETVKVDAEIEVRDVIGEVAEVCEVGEVVEN